MSVEIGRGASESPLSDWRIYQSTVLGHLGDGNWAIEAPCPSPSLLSLFYSPFFLFLLPSSFFSRRRLPSLPSLTALYQPLHPYRNHGLGRKVPGGREVRRG